MYHIYNEQIIIYTNNNNFIDDGMYDFVVWVCVCLKGANKMHLLKVIIIDRYVCVLGGKESWKVIYVYIDFLHLDDVFCGGMSGVPVIYLLLKWK